MTYNFADPPEWYFRFLFEVEIEITCLQVASYGSWNALGDPWSRTIRLFLEVEIEITWLQIAS